MIRTSKSTLTLVLASLAGLVTTAVASAVAAALASPPQPSAAPASASVARPSAARPPVAQASTSTAQPSAPRPSSMVDWKTGMMSEAWRHINKPAESAWTLRVTPPLPLGWGGQAPLAWVIYGYGAGFNPRLADAERVTAPFAIGRIGRPPAPGVQPETRVETLTNALDRGEPQGVHPITRPGAPVDWSAVEQRCFSMTAPPAPGSRDAALLRAAYREWLDSNGVIAGHLRRDHRAFFDWLRAGD